MRKRSRWIATLAFFERALLRSLGMYKSYVPGQDIERRSREMLALLQQPKDSLRYRITLESSFPWDLFDEESALLPDALELQARLIEIAPQEESIHLVVAKWVQGSPVSKLTLAIIEQAAKDNASQVRIEFSKGEMPVRVIHGGTAGQEPAMTIPYKLSNALKGGTMRVERSYEGIRNLADRFRALPARLLFTWESPDVVIISLS